MLMEDFLNTLLIPSFKIALFERNNLNINNLRFKQQFLCHEKQLQKIYCFENHIVMV